jgi:predicted O-linked N-acetylglucosamine transferase (SPINDLY family)
MPSIDYFLSSELMEPEGAEAFYTERLVRLPGLGCCYLPDGVAPSLVKDGPPVFWSGQALYKYLPAYDWIYPAIAAETGSCLFVFIAFAKSRDVTDAFLARMGAAFAAAGLEADRHVVMLPAMSQDAFLEAVRRADVILDTPGWSGGKSTLDCLAVDPAIVTWPGRFMRGRHTAAILRRIGCEATIAGSAEEYVSLAVRLGRDVAWRAEVRGAVSVGKRAVYEDLRYVRELESFLVETVAALG